MRKKMIIGTAVLLLIGIEVSAQDIPKSCTYSITPFNEGMKSKITSQVKNAHNYFMYSTDSAAGKTYKERTTNLSNAINQTFQEFMEQRRIEYRRTICSYYKEDWNSTQSSSSSWRTITCQPGFIFITTSMKPTGRILNGPNLKSTTVRWKTGRSTTSVSIQAKYDESYIAKIIIDELRIAQIELNALGIPTEVPPFLN